VAEYELIVSADALGRVANDVANAGVVGLDLETTALKPHHGKIRLMQINTGKNTYVIDLFQTKTLGPVKDALASDKVIKILQNVKFDQKWLLYHYNLELWPVFCTFRASVLLHNGKNLGHNLYDLYNRELGIYPEVEDQGASNWAGVLSEEQLAYAAEDVQWLHALRDKLKPQLAKAGLNKVALIEFGVIAAEGEVENKGIFLDKKRWLDLAAKNREKRDEVKRVLLDELPNPSNQLTFPGMDSDFNLDSSAQVLASLRKLGIVEKERGEDGKPTGSKIPLSSTREIVLAQHVAKYPVLKHLFAYREYSKACSTYGPDYLENIDPITGRIHCGYYPFTGAGRYACSKPNIQQVPRSALFRACFRPRPGYVYVIADYSAIEMRIAAQVAPDPTLIDVFRRDVDAHSYTAALVNDLPYETVARGVAAEDKLYKGMRQAAKAVNFGLVYGMGAEKLVLYAQANYGVTLSIGQAKRFRERYFENYSGIQRWHGRALRDGKRNHEARTLAGRKRYLNPEKSYNEFFNTPVQGSGADGLKAALREVRRRLKKHGEDAEIVHHVHDEIIVETKEEPELIRQVCKDVEGGMVDPMAQMLTAVPVVVEANSGASWAEAK
jgi:DNA polymerase I-like protein with 3'-5' exonuclease and polymerase domains